MNDANPTSLATFGAGCFWGVEHAFRSVSGVLDVRSGYEGGVTANPTYADVCSNETGHAEVVRIHFDPSRTSYDALLDAFWSMHDPTSVRRKDGAIATQYRSAIFFHTTEQRDAARASLANVVASGRFAGDVLTEIVPAQTFYVAEAYHQRYFEKNGVAEHA